jgi:ribosomal protein L40E
VNLGENFSNSFDYAKKLFSDIGRLIILIILTIIPVADLIVVGYAARVLRESPGSEGPPKLERYGELFVDGVKVFFASLIYMIVPAILIGAGIGSLVAGVLMAGELAGASALALGGTGLVLLIVGIILAFFLFLLLGAGLAHMIKTGKFGRAFAFGEILRIIRGIGWLKYVGWAIIIYVLWIIIAAIIRIPVLGGIIFVVVLPVFSTFVFRSLGLLYNEGAPAELKAQAMPATAGGSVCVSCGAPLQPFHKFCPSCGTAAPVPPMLSPLTPATMEGSKFCISCGAKLAPGTKFCGSCGAKQP